MCTWKALCGQERSRRRRWRISISRQLPSNYCMRLVFKFYQQTGAVSKENQTSTCTYPTWGDSKWARRLNRALLNPSPYFCSRGKAAQRKLLWTCLATFNGHGKVDSKNSEERGRTHAHDRAGRCRPAGRPAAVFAMQMSPTALCTSLCVHLSYKLLRCQVNEHIAYSWSGVESGVARQGIRLVHL